MLGDPGRLGPDRLAGTGINNTGVTFDAGYDGTTNPCYFRGDGCVKSAAMDSVLTRLVFPQWPDSRPWDRADPGAAISVDAAEVKDIAWAAGG